MARLYIGSYKPEPGDLVSGLNGKRQVRGRVVADPSHPTRAKVRSVGWGKVLLFVNREPDGREVGIYEVGPAAEQAVLPGFSPEAAEPHGPVIRKTEEPTRIVAEAPAGMRWNRWGDLVPTDTADGDAAVDRMLAEMDSEPVELPSQRALRTGELGRLLEKYK